MLRTSTDEIYGPDLVDHFMQSSLVSKQITNKREQCIESKIVMCIHLFIYKYELNVQIHDHSTAR